MNTDELIKILSCGDASSEEQGEAADLIEQMRISLDKVTRSAWRLAHWNDHNHGYDDLTRWREDTRNACRVAEPHLIHPARD